MHIIYPISKPLSLLFLHSKNDLQQPFLQTSLFMSEFGIPTFELNISYLLKHYENNYYLTLFIYFFGELRSSLPWINWAIQPPVQTNRLFRTYLTLYFSRVHTSNLCMPIIPSSLYLLFQLNFLCHLLNILSYWYLIYLGFKSSLGVICMQVTCKIVELDGKQKVAETLVKFYNYLNMTYKVTLCLLLF